MPKLRLVITDKWQDEKKRKCATGTWINDSKTYVSNGNREVERRRRQLATVGGSRRVKKMVGFLNLLTPEQMELALAYDGPDMIGDQFLSKED